MTMKYNYLRVNLKIYASLPLELMPRLLELRNPLTSPKSDNKVFKQRLNKKGKDKRKLKKKWNKGKDK